MSSRVLFLVVVFGLPLALLSPLGAGPEAESRRSAKQALKDAVQALRRVENYRVSFAINGGLTGRPDHRITKQTFEWEGSALIGGNARARILHVPEADVFRLATKGAGVWKAEDGVWRPLVLGFLSRKAAEARATNLLDFPERYLAKALKLSREATWHRAAGAATDPGSPAAAEADGSDPVASNPVVRVRLIKKAALELVADEVVDKLIGGCCGAVTYTRLSPETTEVYFDVEIDSSTSQPVRVALVFVTGQYDGRVGANLFTLGTPNEKVVGDPDERVTFRFEFTLSDFNKVPVKVPPEARKALAQVR